MKNLTRGMRSLALAAALTAGVASVAYAVDPMVGGAPMMASKTIVENASQAKNLTTLVSAVKEAGLVDTLSGAGPFTVFAPTNEAFAKVPKATLEKLMQPDMKADLTKNFHLSRGRRQARRCRTREGHQSRRRQLHDEDRRGRPAHGPNGRQQDRADRFRRAAAPSSRFRTYISRTAWSTSSAAF